MNTQLVKSSFSKYKRFKNSLRTVRTLSKAKSPVSDWSVLHLPGGWNTYKKDTLKLLAEF